MLKIIGKAKSNVRIGYITHNGHEAVIGRAPNRRQAEKACAYGIAMAETNKEQARHARLWLASQAHEKHYIGY